MRKNRGTSRTYNLVEAIWSSPLSSSVPPVPNEAARCVQGRYPPNVSRPAGTVTSRGSRVGLVLLAAALGALGGCYQPVFSTRDDRSQYDRYDARQNRRAEPYVDDPFGRRKPNLRGLLLPPE